MKRGKCPLFIVGEMFNTLSMQKNSLNVAVTGASGVGKSSFINSICGLSAEDEEGAHADIVEATKEVTPYLYPKNKNIVFWDLPGIGTPNFPREKYFKKVQFKKYDFFLILSAGRFRDDDLWLVREVKRQNKDFYFVRTQMEVDVSSDKKAHPKSHDKRRIIFKIRTNILQNLADYGFRDASIFLIDNYNTSNRDYDFETLKSFLISKVDY